uniref:Uncharacterized protein n=1 Tax=Eucampia antarctica TaxID=49252 RepID=A0A7S2R249_9STRA|mmetsp:Transcript_13625/g.13202  ORF Transcript_13625/g.13202 Transcript_13625/m.13202 type:complete len:105 (+) Transcript_13625:67-381(+)
MIRALIFFALINLGLAFQLHPQTNVIGNRQIFGNKKVPYDHQLFAKRDASRSGTKRDRLDKLAELEDSRIETDSNLVVKGGLAFVGLIVVLLGAAFASGVLDTY